MCGVFRLKSTGQKDVWAALISNPAYSTCSIVLARLLNVSGVHAACRQWHAANQKTRWRGSAESWWRIQNQNSHVETGSQCSRCFHSFDGYLFFLCCPQITNYVYSPNHKLCVLHRLRSLCLLTWKSYMQHFPSDLGIFMNEIGACVTCWLCHVAAHHTLCSNLLSLYFFFPCHVWGL